MRHRLSAIIGILLIGSCLNGVARAQADARWWPFGRSEGSEAQPEDAVFEPAASTPNHVGAQPPSTQYLPEEEPEQRWMIDSRLGKVSWPRLHVPQMPWSERAEADETRNTWAHHDPARQQPGPLGAVRRSVHRVGEGTRAAWDKTVDALTPGVDSDVADSQTAQREVRPPWWRRMLSAKEQPQGPQTVTEWMAQDRLDP
jgi:hypothetical protein